MHYLSALAKGGICLSKGDIFKRKTPIIEWLSVPSA